MTDVLGPQGGDFLDGLDLNDPDYIRELLRPANIKEDVKLMEQRRRVSLILHSQAFRKELEKIVASQMRDGVLSPNVQALKQLVDMLTPHAKLGSSAFSKDATVPVIPVNDLRSSTATFSKAEKVIRCKVASTYRLVDIFGWSSGSKSHISAKIFKDGDSYLFNPEGLLHSEITASRLVKIGIKGNILDDGSNGLGIDRQGWMLHAAVHEALPTVRCIIQLNTPATIAVSCMHSSLPPISQEAIMLGPGATYDPSSLDPSLGGEARLSAQSAAVAAALEASPTSPPRLLIVRKHGLLALGTSVEEAWMSAYLAVSACEAQLRLACVGADELVMPSAGDGGSGGQVDATAALNATTGVERNWRPGELEFEAMMRRLDAAGYHTGHLYRVGQVQSRTRGIPEVPDGVDGGMTRAEQSRRAASLGRGYNRGEVEVPPAASSFATNYYKDDATRIKEAAAYRAKTLSLGRTHLINTPNTYQKEEIEEVGTAHPKKITKWTEGATRTTGGTLVASEDPNQFAPQGEDPSELKTNLKKVREMYYKDVRNAGPQSKILMGLDDEGEGGFETLVSADSRDGTLASAPGGGRMVSPRGTLLRLDPANPPALEPGHVVVVGAVSKGIINRDQRHNVGLFQSVYSPNPFEQVTDEELERYKRNVERRAKGLPTEEEEQEEEERRRRAATLESAQVLSVQNGDAEPEGIRSDTSADAGQPSQEDSKTQRKKRRFKMPSFARKGKDKKKASRSKDAAAPGDDAAAAPK